MCEFKAMGVPWPPQGWDHFKIIHATHGQSIHKDPKNARIVGLQYHIQPVPGAPKSAQRNDYSYALSIGGWEYTISDDSKEFPILSFYLKDKGAGERAADLFLSQLKVDSKLVAVTKPVVDRALMASLFFIRQIQNNRVPDWNRILKFYRLRENCNSLKEAGLSKRKRTPHFINMASSESVSEYKAEKEY